MGESAPPAPEVRIVTLALAEEAVPAEPARLLGYHQRALRGDAGLLGVILVAQFLALLAWVGEWSWEAGSGSWSSRSTSALESAMRLWELASAFAVSVGTAAVLLLTVAALAGHKRRRGLLLACGFVLLLTWSRVAESVGFSLMSEAQNFISSNPAILYGSASGILFRLSEAARISYPLILLVFLWTGSGEELGTSRKSWQVTRLCGASIALLPVLSWVLLPRVQWIGTSNALWEFFHRGSLQQLVVAIGRLATFAGSLGILIAVPLPARVARPLFRVGALLLIAGAAGNVHDSFVRITQLFPANGGPGAGGAGFWAWTGAAGGRLPGYGSFLIRLARCANQVNYLGSLIIVPVAMRMALAVRGPRDRGRL
jgi:hypothetical protein